MKIIERILYILTIVVLVLYSVQKPKKIIEYSTISGDSIPYEKIVSHDSLIYNDTQIYNVDTLWLHDTTFYPVDTNKILSDYFKMISYDSINLRNDSSITNWVKLRITQNRLYDITGYSLNNRKQIIISQYNNGLNIGAIAGKNIFSPTISYQYNKHNFGLGYNIYNNGIMFKYEYRIDFKNKK